MSGGAGGEGAPDLTETLLNLSINSAALAAFSFLFFRDLQGAERDKKVVDREELLGRLLVSPAHVPVPCPSRRQRSTSCNALSEMLSLPLYQTLPFLVSCLEEGSMQPTMKSLVRPLKVC